MKNLKDRILLEAKQDTKSLSENLHKVYEEVIISFIELLKDKGEVTFDKPIDVVNVEDYENPGEIYGVAFLEEAPNAVSINIGYGGHDPEWVDVDAKRGLDIMHIEDVLWLMEKVEEQK